MLILKKFATYLGYLPMPGNHLNRVMLREVFRSNDLQERVDRFTGLLNWSIVSALGHGLPGLFILFRVVDNKGDAQLLILIFLTCSGIVLLSIAISAVYVISRGLSSLRSGVYSKYKYPFDSKIKVFTKGWIKTTVFMLVIFFVGQQLLTNLS